MPPELGFRTFADPPDDAPGDDRRADADLPLLSDGGGRLSARSLLIVLAFSGVMLLPALGGSLRVLTVHEVFAAQTAREMFQTGDWIVPHFAGVPRTNKPPGMYWLIAGFMAMFQSRAEWVVRLPAALAGIVTAVMIARLTARWLGDFAGVVAGLMQASLFYVLMQARLAEADMPMCAAVTLAMCAFASVLPGARASRPPGGEKASNGGPRDGAKRSTVVSPSTTSLGREVDSPPAGETPALPGAAFWFGLGTGLSVLFKGVGIAFVFAGCILWIVLTRRWRSFRVMFHPASLLPMLVVGLSWPIAAYLRDPAIAHELFFESVERAAGAFDDADPWHIYFWSVPLLLLPWLPFAVRGLVQWWRTNARHADDRSPAARLGLSPHLAFLLCWFAGGMTILLVSQARHKHYAIPMLPPMTVLAAAGFVWWLRDRKRPAVRPAAIVAGAAAVGVIVAAALLTPRFLPQAPAGAAVTIAAVAIGIAATVILYAARRWRATTAACFLTALAGGVGAQTLVLPAFDDYKASTALAREADRLTPPGEPVYFVLIGQSQAAYYIDHPLQRVDGKKKLPEFFAAASAGQTFHILCEQSTVELLRPYGQVTVLAQADHLRRSETDRLVFVRLRVSRLIPSSGTPGEG